MTRVNLSPRVYLRYLVETGYLRVSLETLGSKLVNTIVKRRYDCE